MAGSLIGSPTHMSPEQARGERATPQSDLYSFGITLYEFIACEPPLKSESTHGLLMAHIYQVPCPLRDLRADVPQSLSAIIARALEKDPAKRFATAGDLLTALRESETAAVEGTATITSFIAGSGPPPMNSSGPRRSPPLIPIPCAPPRHIHRSHGQGGSQTPCERYRRPRQALQRSRPPDRQRSRSPTLPPHPSPLSSSLLDPPPLRPTLRGSIVPFLSFPKGICVRSGSYRPFAPSAEASCPFCHSRRESASVLALADPPHLRIRSVKGASHTSLGP